MRAAFCAAPSSPRKTTAPESSGAAFGHRHGGWGSTLVAEPPGIELHGVSARYGAVEALRELSLFLPSGSFTAVLGPNGAGKSTLVRALTRVIALSGGRIRYGERELGEISQAELARTVAVVPQDVWVPFSYTVLEMVLMGRAPHLGMLGWEGEEDVAKARAALERLELLHLGDRPLPNLSGGERQRVLLARALAQEAPILILDEPTAHLDIAHQQRTLELMAELHREGRTVIAVLHDLNLASLYCPRLVLLHEGRLAADGPPAEVLTESRLASTALP
jgi:iron complex transport system ATP-binding protein